MKKGFTLIELLVVVLIIGILTAAALPQYALAVEKARASEGAVLMRAIAQSAQRYYMENKRFPASNDFDSLDITLPTSTDSDGNTYTGTKNYKISTTNNSTNCGSDYSINLSEANKDFGYVLAALVRQDGSIIRYCTKAGVWVNAGCSPVKVEPNSSRGRKLCHAITGGHSIDGQW